MTVLLDDGCVLTQQFQTRLAWQTASAGGDNYSVDISHFLNFRCSDDGGRIKRRAMSQVHRFTLGNVPADVIEEQFIRDTRMERRDRDAGAHPSGADDRNSSLHVRIRIGGPGMSFRSVLRCQA